MSLRDLLGLYGPNKPKWPNDTYQAITDSRVSWVVWRTDADPEAPIVLASLGVKVIAQAPDRFNGNPHLDPAAECTRFHTRLLQTCPPGTPFVFDNEPNLHPLKAGSWYAEQWTRYARAYIATWRYYDPGGLYPVVLPALAVGPDRNGALWHQTQRENLAEADAVGLHAYWQHQGQIDQADFGAPSKLLPFYAGPHHWYVLEYGNTLPGKTHADTLDQYERWLGELPPGVQMTALFGLDLTDDWDRFRITPEVIAWLARLE